MPRGRGTSLGSALRRVTAALAIGAIFLGVFTAWRIASQGDRDERRPADAIVVLGAAQFNGTPSPVFEARLDHAIELYNEGLAPYLVVTGGKTSGDVTTEAGAARAYVTERGVPDGAVLSENQGRTTEESVAGVATLFEARGLRSAVFVSDRTHMLRVLRMAADRGIVSWGSPTTTSPIDQDGGRHARALMHEMAGLAAYYLGGLPLLDDSAVIGTP
ncbi:MAG TPA: YdcF family protein [Candidatus Limnocylindrales bacterium]|nr:YdcF family protein [Candidatus Limnocylindrales bacterium]